MLHRLAEAAQHAGVFLAMESLRPEESQLVVTLADARRMLDEVNHPHLKIMIDTTAMGVAGETIQAWFDAFGDDIIHLHFIDGDPYGHLIWGDGAHSLPGFISALNHNGYTGYLGQEITDARYFRDPPLRRPAQYAEFREIHHRIAAQQNHPLFARIALDSPSLIW